MSKVVQVAPGYSGVPLYSGTLNQGQTMILTDTQFNNLPGFIQQQLQVVSASQDDYMISLPDTNFTANLISVVLRNLGVPLFLSWDGTQYQPSKYIADMTRVKVFIGPTDPSTVPGAFIGNNDQWISEA